MKHNHTYQPKDYGKVAVLMGGLSAEREISLESGQAVLKALLNKGVNAHAVDVGTDIWQVLGRSDFDRAFVILHGRGGEDGVIQGALEAMNLPYTGSGVIGSALAMDKIRSKRIWQSCELPTPGFAEIHNETDWNLLVEELGLPIMVKPSHEGSSFGASKVKHADDLERAWRAAAEYDTDVVAEQWITGGEYTVPILGRQVLPMIRLLTPREFYDYEAKYVEDTTQYLCPCGLEEIIERELGKLAMSAFDALGAYGWGRVDMMLDENQKPWLIEVNTVPGMTGHSLVPMAAKQAGLDFDDLVLAILDTCMRKKTSRAA
jgi:D-alanine-D-alanine ligase